MTAYENDTATWCDEHAIDRDVCGCRYWGPTPGGSGQLDPNEAAHRGQPRIAYRLAAAYAGKLLHVKGLGWFVWDGARWAEDTDGFATRAVLDVLRATLAAALGDKNLRADVSKCESAAGINGVLAIAGALNPLTATVDSLDGDPWLLNCANGTLDLRTFELREHRPSDRITKVTRAAYRPESQSRIWENFLERVLLEQDVRDYLQRLIGLSLLGKVEEHIFTIATGTGANGKGTTYNAVLHAMGDYGHVAESDLFMASKSNPNSASPAQFGLRGKRLVVVSETEKDRKLATALMKNLTGGDPITARPLYGKPITFQPSHTSLMVTNFLPKVAGDDPAAWRRIRVVPFNEVIPEADRDPRLGQQLELEADAVLTWAIQGWRHYRQMGMAAPAAVTAATDDYQKQSDALARFIEECCLVGPHFRATLADLFSRWSSWVSDDGAEQLSKKAFTEALERHGYPTSKGHANVTQVQRLGVAAEDAEEVQGSWSSGF